MSHLIKKFAPAKLNLNLHVTGVRDDGYHLIESIICFTDFGDDLEFVNADDTELKVDGMFADLIDPHNNLVLGTLDLFKRITGINKSVKIKLTKNIPVGAGLGGGSADAAATISGLCELWNVDMSTEKLLEIGLNIGADVPVCQFGGSAIVGGIGEHLQPIDVPEFYVVMVNPGIALSTAEVFKKGFADYKDGIGYPPVEENEWSAFLQSTRNDLETNAIEIVPQIRNILEVIRGLDGAIISRMSGSGATCFALFSDKQYAEKGAQEILKLLPGFWVRVARVN